MDSANNTGTLNNTWKVKTMTVDNLDRQAINRALAKAIAYKNCGKDDAAAEWARALIALLDLKEILN